MMNTEHNRQRRTAQDWVNIAKQAKTQAEQRAAIYQALKLDESNKRLQSAFKRLHQQRHYQRAAGNGIFICYTTSDDLFAIELAETLREEGMNTWIDMLDIPLEQDEGDIEWEDEVQKALDNSGLMLLVLSPAATSSSATQDELDYFMAQGKVVLPLVHRDCNPKHLGLHHPMIDFRDSTTGLTTLYNLLGITIVRN